ncbi:MAG: hypothetical protein WBN22_12720 [Verrucomicrobiia bacterium]
MRTKILLFAAAALAAGVVSSNASPVYSANVVGYYNIPLVAGQQTLVGNQLINGTSNDVATLLGTLPNKTTIATWTGSTFASTEKLGGVWTPSDPQIAVGQGFFIQTSASAGAQTNTFVGTVTANVGASVTNTYAGSVQSLICSPIPYSGTLADTSNIDLGTLPNKTTISVWNPGSSTYSSTEKLGGVWTPSVFSISVGQGFFITPPTAGATLIQSLPSS